MKTQTIPVTMNMPAKLHKKFCKLANICNCDPGFLALVLIESDIKQGHDNQDLEFIICSMNYESIEEAAKVAKAATDFEKPAHIGYFVEVDAESGEICIVSKSRRLFDERLKKVIPFSPQYLH
jgi:hypothetical protein